ncbi:hypothetical protein RQP53_05650 [Paucibacter sp. APW11]|uniref:Agglutinin biogenesis protein MshP n=1 Tax=Roseateles aquae TaxID=3077235 RepID=A0ABU3P848_9BURK|nr:hypothetical protein [Paucibacter sp. APW11]MDT8998751.1 hypothetical protein [Paucibacter sp. APW11]
MKQAAQGFTMMSALFILVVLTALGATLAQLSMRQHLGAASELEQARAYQAALAGLEFGSFQILRNAVAQPPCFATTSIAFGTPAQPGPPGMTVTVSCSRTPGSGTVSDGSTQLAFYQLLATACNAPNAGSCPGASPPQPSYVERQLARTLQR